VLVFFPAAFQNTFDKSDPQNHEGEICSSGLFASKCHFFHHEGFAHNSFLGFPLAKKKAKKFGEVWVFLK